MGKIGIMGGTFNPIHIAHLILAESTYEQLHLDKVLIMPSHNPPHKLHEQILKYEHRVRMIQLAIEDNSHLELSCLELEREGKTYTADTLEVLTNSNPNNEYYFILGADSLLQIEGWKNPSKVFQLAHVVAAGRYHLPIQVLEKQINHLEKNYHARIHLLQTPNIDLSSEMLRERIRDGKSIRYYVPNQVEQYILENELYK